MSTINALGTSFASNSAVGQNASLMLSPNAPDSFGEAFNLSLTQQVDKNGASGRYVGNFEGCHHRRHERYCKKTGANSGNTGDASG